MKKLIFVTFYLSVLLFMGSSLNAQSGNAGTAGNVGLSASPSNVLKWTREVLPKMELLAGKLEKIKPDNAKDIESQKNYLKALQTLRSINTRGTKLTAAEASKHDTWFKGIVQVFFIECKSYHGNVCCNDCINHGILGVWCLTSCFVANFPDNNN